MEELIDVAKQLRRMNKKNLERVKKQQVVLEECIHWEKAAHDAQLIQSNLYRIKRGQKLIEVEDWLQEGKVRSLELDPLLEPHLQLAKKFKKAKKLKAGIPYAKRQLEVVEADAKRTQQASEELALVKTLEELEQFYCRYPFLRPITPSKRHVETEQPKPYHSFQSANETLILVGKNAKGNDSLTFHYANGSDWWLHAHLYPGSHVIIKTKKGEEPDRETLLDAAELALRYSKAKDIQEGEVCLSQVKYLKRVKGTPGMVTLSWHKILFHKQDKERWERLKSSKP